MKERRNEVMQTVDPSDLKSGITLMLNGVPCLVEEVYVVGTAKTKHKPHARLRNLKTGHIYERTFNESERLPVAELDQRTVEFSYSTGDDFVFLDSTTYEELRLSRQQIGERHWFLKEDLECKALFLDGKILDVIIPESVALKVETTAPPQRGGQSSAYKPATLEGGLEIMVPLFIAPGDIIRVDIRFRKYMRKESE